MSDEARLKLYNDWKDSVNEAASDLHDLADKLGFRAAKGRQNDNGRLYHSAQTEDKSPSLSIFQKQGSFGWKDYSAGEQGGDAISFYRYWANCDYKTAVEKLADLYNVPKPDYKAIKQVKQEKSIAEFIADRCLQPSLREKAVAYLEGRDIDKAVIEQGFNRKSIGWNDWTSPSKPEGEVGHGGEGVSFIVHDVHDNKVVAVDTRYAEPDLNGGVKTNSQGDKEGFPWVLDWNAFKKAHTVVVVESSINALSVLSCGLPFGYTALALRGTQNAENVPMHLFEGKFVVIAMDYDAPHPKEHRMAGHRPGPEAGWKLIDRLTEADIPALMVDQTEWELGDDINDVLVKEGKKALFAKLKKLETCAIPGMMPDHHDIGYRGKKRVFLPSHDYSKYWRFKVHEDFTQYIASFKDDPDNDKPLIEFEDLAGFRVAGIERVSIQDWMATAKGGKPSAPEILFTIAAQTPQHGRQLKRLTMTDEQYSSVQQWSKFGYIHKPAEFMRLTSILTRMVDSSERMALNFVGLAFKQGRPVLNQGDQCFFRYPEEQCPYSSIKFHTGNKSDAKKVINAFQATFTDNAALIPLVWALGAHLKLFLGFWPHLQMQAEKGSGKSTFLDKLGDAIQMQVYSKEMLKSDYRIQCSVSYTSQPVAWEEISTNAQHVIQAANSTLQEAFNYRYSIRGNQGKSFLSCAPVLLGGEEVDMDSLLGKMCRTSLTFKKQGDEIEPNLPRFPMRNWLEYLAELSKEQVLTRLNASVASCLKLSNISKDDANAKRIVKNFASVRLAWHYLCEFAGIDVSQGGFERSLMDEMNHYLAETEADRKPWVWILEIILSEIDAKRYAYPYDLKEVIGEDGEKHRCILLRHTQIMNHIRHSTHLRQRWDALPIRKAKTLKGQMLADGAIINEDVEGKDVSAGYVSTKGTKTAKGRISHMMAVSLDVLDGFGLRLTREA